MLSELIMFTYPFVIFASLITAGIMTYAVAKTSDTRAALRWLMIGTILISLSLALENTIEWYGKFSWDGTLYYTVKLSYGFGMWMNFCSAWTAIRGKPPVRNLLLWGLCLWVATYVLVLLVSEIRS